MRKSAFTLIEIIVALIIVGIVTTLGIPAYRNYIEESRAKLCENNLKALHAALDIYVMEQGSVPGSWGAIPQDYFNRGYAKVMEHNKNKWKIELAYIVLGLTDKNYAYALSAGPGPGPGPGPGFSALDLLNRLVRGNHNLLICPADTRTDAGKISYALNQNLEGMTVSQYKACTNMLEIIDKDGLASDPATLRFVSDNQGTARHKKAGILCSDKSYAQGVYCYGAVRVGNCVDCKKSCKEAYCRCMANANNSTAYRCYQICEKCTSECEKLIRGESCPAPSADCSASSGGGYSQ